MGPEDKKDNNNEDKRTDKTDLLNINDRNLLFRSPSFSYAVQKIEKLSAAVHLVTNFIPSTESLRGRLRKISVDILSGFLALDSGDVDQGIIQASLENDIFELITLLNIAHTAGYVSLMNKDVLSREYNELLSFLTQHADAISSQVTEISDKLLEVPFENEGPTRDSKVDLARKGQAIDKLSPTSVKDTSRPATSQGQAGSRAPRNGSVTKRRNERRSTILNLIKSQNKIGVKDVSPLISGCSEKTLQRELLAMVDEGILTKEGERRWSTYSLAT